MLARGATCPSQPPAGAGIGALPALASAEGNNLPSVGIDAGASDPLNCAHPPGAGWVAGAPGVSGVELLSSFNLSQPPGQGPAENGNSCAGEDAGAGAGEGEGAGEGAGGGGLGADWPFSLAQPPILLAGGGLTRLRVGGPGPPSSPLSSTEGEGFGLTTEGGRLFVSLFELGSHFFSSSAFSDGLSTLSTRRGLGWFGAGSAAAAAFNIPQPEQQIGTWW